MLYTPRPSSKRSGNILIISEGINACNHEYSYSHLSTLDDALNSSSLLLTSFVQSISSDLSVNHGNQLCAMQGIVCHGLPASGGDFLRQPVIDIQIVCVSVCLCLCVRRMEWATVIFLLGM